jgi:thiamine-phosphate pyrophosphorylase
MKPRFDLSLYLVTDPVLAGSRPLEEIVAAAIAGGATMVQLRDPHAKGRALTQVGLRLLAVTRPAGVPLIVNDRADVAFAIGAQGVHLGQSDMDATDARRMLGPDAIIGLSIAEARELEASRHALPAVDYLGVGPVFATGTKSDAGDAIGLAGISWMRRAVGLPLVAIGGINETNAAEVVAAGCDGVAVVSAIIGAQYPAKAGGQLSAAVKRGRDRE